MSTRTRHSPDTSATHSTTSTHCQRYLPVQGRRDFLRNSAMGFGASIAGLLIAQDAGATDRKAHNSLAPREPHFPARAKRVIFLFAGGGPSQLETFDPKPALTKHHGQPIPESFKTEGLSLQFMKASDGKLMASPFPFTRQGDSGLEISSLFPHLSRHADDLAVIRSCHHESFIHGPASAIMNTGSSLLGHPSSGAWVTYGLGSMTENLPAYMTMTDGGFRAGPAVSYGSGFLPAIYQGTVLHAEGMPISNLTAAGAPGQQRMMLDTLRHWNGRFAAKRPEDSRLAAQLANYELAYRMQTAAPDLINIAHETAATRELYGVDKEPTAKFGRMCLLARRMAEKGVRFIQLFNNDWDGHAECAQNHAANASRTDQPIAALLTDLKQRGLLDSTLVVWAGEFGRTPVMQGSNGRDHSPYGFSVWLAGGGVRGGQAIGATDELGFRAVEKKVHVHDLHATILAALGFDHEKLIYHFEGRDRRLTDVFGHIVKEVFS
jgi:uncharacterized protein (DUF1501 family)